MKILEAWAIALLIAALYLALGAEIDYRAARTERCAVMHCS
jgi:hypothetical protein